MTIKVLVVGCFDLYHLGHCDLFEQARRLGSHLTVGVASDNILKAYKNRQPIFRDIERKQIISTNRHVDEVYIYGESCPDPIEASLEDCIEHNRLAQLDLINSVKPNILAQGQDRTCPLEGILEEYGIRRVFLPRLSESHISTSGYIKKIRMFYEENTDT